MADIWGEKIPIRTSWPPLLSFKAKVFNGVAQM